MVILIFEISHSSYLKAFDSINHELVISKLFAYRFSKDALKLIHSYMSDHFQKTKINKSFSSWSALIKGVLQGSVLGPFLFKFYSSNFFYFLDCNIHNFDLKNLDFSLERLEQQSSIALRWFEDN